MLEGLTAVLQTLAEKVSRKAAVITIAMILIYALGAGSGASNAVLCVWIIASLATFFTFVQAFIDNKSFDSRSKKKKEEIVSMKAPSLESLVAPNEEEAKDESFEEAKEVLAEI